ncbi:MAG: septum formation family protein [Longimicrobiales bacterium]|nr:septum formation family protein [Longimicrobiales bacterium]
MVDTVKKVVGWSAVAGVAVFGGVNAFGDDTTRNAQNEIVEAGGLGAFAIEVGDCLNLPSDLNQVQSVEGVPCNEAHSAQAYALFDLVGFGDEFPGAEAFAEQAGQGCYDRFEGFVGVPYEESELYFTNFEPTAESWTQLDDREIVCLLVPETGTFSYDAQNSGR